VLRPRTIFNSCGAGGSRHVNAGRVVNALVCGGCFALLRRREPDNELTRCILEMFSEGPMDLLLASYQKNDMDDHGYPHRPLSRMEYCAYL